MSSLVMLLCEHLLVVTDAALQVREAVQLLLRVVFFIVLRQLSRTVVALVLVTPNWLVFFFFVPGVIVQIVEFHSFDLVHLMAVVVPLLGESELTLVLLARCQVLLEHSVLVSADFLSLPLDPLLRNLLGSMLLFLNVRKILLQVSAIFLQLSLGQANMFALLAQFVFLELELVSLRFLQLFELNDLLGDVLLTDDLLLFELAEVLFLLA
jgi:hypothetical protein